MNWFPFSLAWRYMWGTSGQQTIKTMVRVCGIALFIGSGALALTMCVMRGFEQATHQLLQNIHAPIIMASSGNKLEYTAIAAVLDNEFPEIVAYSPNILHHAIIKDPVSKELLSPIMIKGILPQHEEQTTQLASYLQQTFLPSQSLPTLLTGNHVLIGQRLATALNVSVGDSIELVYAPDQTNSNAKLYLSCAPVLITGIFKTGLEEIDAGMLYCNLLYLDTLFDKSGVDSLAIKPAATTNTAQLITRLKSRFGLDVYQWQDLYPALVTALQLESYAMFLILSLIVLVASMSIIALLFMQIQHKRGDIAILYTLGASHSLITRTFLCMGITVAGISCFAGLACAGLLAWCINRFQLISLPDSYLISHLPVSFEPHIFIGIFIFVILISSIATWIPCRYIRTLDISMLLRQG